MARSGSEVRRDAAAAAAEAASVANEVRYVRGIREIDYLAAPTADNAESVSDFEGEEGCDHMPLSEAVEKLNGYFVKYGHDKVATTEDTSTRAQIKVAGSMAFVSKKISNSDGEDKDGELEDLDNAFSAYRFHVLGRKPDTPRPRA